MPPAKALPGTVGRGSARFYDVSVSVDGENTTSSTHVGDRGIFISDDGERQREQLSNVTHKKQKLHKNPKGLNDDLATWEPMDDVGCGVSPAMDQVSGDTSDTRGTRKRKGYTSSDEPMSLFPNVQELYLDETLRCHGLGYNTRSQKCACCTETIGPTAVAGSGKKRIFRCHECGVFLQCQDCCLNRHATSPLHFIEEWKDEYWHPLTLKTLGLVVQLGHDGFPCPFPDPEPNLRSMTVIDTTGIHQIHYKYCSCGRFDVSHKELRQLLRHEWYPASMTDPDTCATFRVLDLFRLLNVTANVNAKDFIASLERMTDATASTGMYWLPDRYKAFLRMTRQWAFIQRARRAGRAHEVGGLKATKQGELTPACWTCPYDGRNLPLGWREVDPEFRYMYRLILALDANFKLKNRIRACEHDDPSLGPGWGAFVEPTRYKKHLRKYVAEKDVSTCIAFAALTQKETRNTAGLRVSGVGGCVCARHECIRPNGLGDLQKGERYANMDYILMSALVDVDLKEFTLSYDIACQWKKNFNIRMAKLPTELQRDFSDVLLQAGLPVWHALAHEQSCTNENSLGFLPGVGKTDGEGIERLWAILNAIAFATKEMGLGNRADSVEDRLDAHNFLKNLGQPDSLRRKLIVAYAERERQVAAFKEINKSIHSELRDEWQKKIDSFVADHTKPNPYVLTVSEGQSEAQIRLALKLEEKLAADQGLAPLHATSATAFLTAGLQLEETQRRIRTEVSHKARLTKDRELKVEEQRLAFFVKLRTFRDLQQVYTPGASRMVAAENAQRETETPAPLAENVRLWLPSQLPADELVRGCQRNVPEMEAKLRESQCHDALSNIRKRLHAKRHLITFRDANVVGQAKATRSHTIIDQVTARVNALADKYTDARNALISLKGSAHAPQFRKLDKADLTLEGEDQQDESDAAKSDRAAAKKLGRIGAGVRPSRISTSSKAGLSWIWVAQGSLSEEEKDLHESLQVEWSRAKARKSRWEEEVVILREEMRHIIRYLTWEEKMWLKRAGETVGNEELTEDLASGLRAYALKQAGLRAELCEYFHGDFNVSIGYAATETVQGADAAIATASTDADLGLTELFDEVPVV